MGELLRPPTPFLRRRTGDGGRPGGGSWRQRPPEDEGQGSHGEPEAPGAAKGWRTGEQGGARGARGRRRTEEGGPPSSIWPLAAWPPGPLGPLLPLAPPGSSSSPLLPLAPPGSPGLTLAPGWLPLPPLGPQKPKGVTSDMFRPGGSQKPKGVTSDVFYPGEPRNQRALVEKVLTHDYE